MKKIFLSFILITACLNSSFSQELQDGQKRWSSSSKLSIDDFKIKIGAEDNDAIYSQFMVTHSIGGFDFMKRNLNQKIENLFLGNASWIDTTKVKSIEKQIQFQQMQFDLAEISARKFRKRILKDKRKISKGVDIVNKINNEIISELSETRLELMRATESGRNEKMVTEWKEKIKSELLELEEFRFENKKKIKLNK
ncbi:hypothetical protein [uncultured Lacinutrix sp.]|uniref:hypothetical protein n=1 Tax=uncultured Lacinutrix sp. TaxID=574032 RepID=UPI00261797EB|nr:hypothetical protein [uncultured Lacinutrix sp.]